MALKTGLKACKKRSFTQIPVFCCRSVLGIGKGEAKARKDLQPFATNLRANSVFHRERADLLAIMK